jgi:hypothetical protein
MKKKQKKKENGFWASPTPTPSCVAPRRGRPGRWRGPPVWGWSCTPILLVRDGVPHTSFGPCPLPSPSPRCLPPPSPRTFFFLPPQQPTTLLYWCPCRHCLPPTPAPGDTSATLLPRPPPPTPVLHHLWPPSNPFLLPTPARSPDHHLVP